MIIVAGFCQVDGRPFNALVGNLADVGSGALYCSIRCKRMRRKMRNAVARRQLGCVMGCQMPAAKGQGDRRLPLCADCLYSLARSCQGKVRVLHKGAAQHLGRRLREKGVVAEPYPCLLCSSWHVGRPATESHDRIEQIALMLRRTLSAEELADLISAWSPDAGSSRRRPHGDRSNDASEQPLPAAAS